MNVTETFLTIGAVSFEMGVTVIATTLAFRSTAIRQRAIVVLGEVKGVRVKLNIAHTEMKS